MRPFNINGNLTNALRSIKPFSGTNPGNFGGCYKEACITLSISRREVFHMLGVQVRPTTIATSGATTTPQVSLEHRQAEYDRANQHICYISSKT